MSCNLFKKQNQFLISSLFKKDLISQKKTIHIEAWNISEESLPGLYHKNGEIPTRLAFPKCIQWKNQIYNYNQSLSQKHKSEITQSKAFRLEYKIKRIFPNQGAWSVILFYSTPLSNHNMPRNLVLKISNKGERQNHEIEIQRHLKHLLPNSLEKNNWFVLPLATEESEGLPMSDSSLSSSSPFIKFDQHNSMASSLSRMIYYSLYDYYDCNLFHSILNNNSLDLMSVLRQVAREIDVLHQNQIIHCDIKLENILIRNQILASSSMVASICDFDTTQLIKSNKAAIVNTQIGTKPCFCPERFHNESIPWDFVDDIYSFGLVALSLLCKKIYATSDFIAIQCHDLLFDFLKNELMNHIDVWQKYVDKDQIDCFIQSHLVPILTFKRFERTRSLKMWTL
jgi:serine/threonine protein kinase